MNDQALANVDGNRYEQGIELARRCLALEPDHVPALECLASCQIELGSLEAARETLERLLRVQPEHAVAQEALSKLTSALKSAAGQPPPRAGAIVVKLQGGLGNQMFQYAAGLALARRTGARLKLDLSFLLDRTPRANFTYRDYCLDLFELAPDCEVLKDGSALAQQFDRIVERQFNFDPRFHRLGANVYLDGYWQTAKYFAPVEEEVRKSFTSFVTPFTGEQQALADQIRSCEAVCLNVRRGDFVNNPVANAFHGVCQESYFQQAVAWIRQRVPAAHFFIFSDDIDWCHSAHLTSGAPTTFVSHDYAGDRFGAYLQLMMQCRHFILPNSSFGWWAAFLGSAADKIVLTPEPWFDSSAQDTSDLLPPSWIRLPKRLPAPQLCSELPLAQGRGALEAPRLSIFIPIYNREHYLGATLDSLLAQTFGDFEIIIADDGSTDGSLAIAQDYARRDRRIRVLALPHQGEVAARNAALQQAHPAASYLMNHDSDDLSLPNKLLKLVTYLEAHPELAIVGCLAEYFDDSDRLLGQPPLETHPKRIRATFGQVNSMVNSAALIRRTVFEKIGGYREEFRSVDDYDFFSRALLAGFELANVPEVLHRIRLHPNSISSTRAQQQELLAAKIRLSYRAGCVAGAASKPAPRLKTAKSSLSILHTVEFYAPHTGGAELVVQQLSERLARRGHRVTVATTHLPDRQFRELNGVSVVGFEVRGKLAEGISGEERQYQQFLREHDADVMMNYAAQQWATDSAFGVLRDVQSRRVNIIAPCGYSALLDERTLRWPNFKAYFEKTLPSILPLYDAAVYHSAIYKDYGFGLRLGLENGIIIPNGTAEEEFTQPILINFREKYGITTRFIGLCVANFYPGKGQERVIDWVRRMQRADFTMVFLGKEGSQLASLQQQASGLNTRFLVGIPRQDTLAAFHAADLFLFGSHIEASPLVIIEAKAARLPFLSTDCGNVREWKGGLVCAPEEMVVQANRLLDNESLRKQLAEEGWREWKEKLTWEAVVDRWEDLYLRKHQERLTLNSVKRTPAGKSEHASNQSSSCSAKGASASAASLTSTSQPKVSIVIPCYNQAHFLREAVQSVVKQTLQDWELIIVNDGSPDKTSEVAQELIKNFAKRRIRLLETPNGGLAQARNSGVQAAQGRYILPLDADDLLHPEMLARTVEVLDAQPERKIVTTFQRHFGVVNTVAVVQPYTLFELLTSNRLSYCSLFRRELWEALGGYNPNMVWGYEDWDFWIGCAERGWYAEVIKEPLFLYRTKASSMVTEAMNHDRELRAQIVLNHPSLFSAGQLARARQALREHEAERADILAQRSISAAHVPAQSRVARQLHARALFQAGQLGEAGKYYWQLAQEEPGDVLTLLALGKCLEEGGEWESAVAIYETAVAARPENALAQENLRVARQQQFAAQPTAVAATAQAERAALSDTGTGNAAVSAPAIDGAQDATGTNPSRPAPPLVSVIVPCYNQAHYLPEAVHSVVQQTFGDWEIVVVNDGSPDDTAGTVAKLQTQYPGRRIRLLNQPNGGLANARNSGIRQAQGHYVYPLDADDKIAPDCLEKSVRLLEENPEIAIAYSDVQEFDKVHRMIPSIEYDLPTLCRFNYITASALYRREAWEAVGGYSEAMREGYEDWNFWLSCGERGFVGRRIAEPLFFYRKQGGSMVCKARQHDHKLKAQLILNHPRLFSVRQQQWAKAVLEGDPSATGRELGPFIPAETELASWWRPATSHAPSSRRVVSSKPHILFTMYGWSEEGGGTILPRQIAKALVRRGHRVSVIYTAAQPLPNRPAYHVETRQEDGVELHAIYNRPVLFCDLDRPDREVDDPRMREVVTGLVRRLQPDVVHYHSLLNFSLSTVEAVGKLGIPAVYTSHNYWPLCPRLYLFQRDLTLCAGPSVDGARCAACLGVPARQADYALRSARGREVLARYVFRHLAVSSRVRELFIQNGHPAERIRVLQQQPESVEWLWREVGANRLAGARADAALQVGFIGSLLPQKGVHVLVGALQGLPAKRVQMHLFGGGNESYVKQLQALDRSWAVEFHGAYELASLPRLLQQMDVVVVPSIWEDCAPLVVAEALAARCPVIGSRIGGIPDFIADGRTGFLVSPGDPKALANALGRFLQEPSLLSRMQQAIEPPRGFGAFLDDLEGHYREALGERAVVASGAGASTAAPEPVRLVWEGSQFVHHSLAMVNRELCLALLRQGHDLSLLPYEPDQFGPEADPRFAKLAECVRRPLDGPAQVHVRHQWPPNFSAPASGKWVLIQPWEFGRIPEQWVQELRHKVDEVWVPSHYVRQCYIESGVEPGKVQVVPNGINPEVFHPGASPRSLPTKKKFKFLFVGGTIARKGVDVLLKAYLETFRASDDVSLVIKDFGTKSFYQGQTLEQEIAKLQKRPQAPEILYLQQELPPQAVPGLYTACDCLVHPYRGEGFGLPVLEAMACGLPVVITGGGAADDFAGEEFAYRLAAVKKPIGDQVGGQKLAGTGWLLEPDCQALTTRLKWIVEHQEEARDKGRRASDYVRRHWTWEHAAQVAAERLRSLQAQSKAEAQARPTRAAVKPSSSPLPACALVGDLTKARELLEQKALCEAWEAAVDAIKARPFHPEACLLLAQIAQAAGDAAAARRCAEHARVLVPEWKPAKRFLKCPLQDKAKPQWLVLPEALQSSNPKAQSRLSVCLIVKNEEQFLERCLQSVRGLADQLVVVDTGSTDRTVEIAKAHGAEIYSFAWCDDFSAARNAALEHARGDWVLVLDADEELPAEQHARLRADLKTNKLIGYRLPIVNHGREAEGQGYVPRLFRNAPGAYYRNRVHEQIFSSLLAVGQAWGLTTGLGTAQLVHHGYAEQVVRERNKVERNLTLLRQAVEEYPTDPHLVMSLGTESARSGDDQAGLTHYRQAFRLLSERPPAGVVPELREILLTQFSCHLYKMRLYSEVITVLASPLAKNGGLTASLHYALGLAHFELGDYRQAVEQMRHCVAKLQHKTHSPINTDILTALPYLCLALSLVRLGETAEAEKTFQTGLAKPQRSEELKLAYAEFLVGQNRPVDALQQLHQMVENNPRQVAVWRLGGKIALSRPEFLEFARDWTGEALRQLPEDEVLVAQRAEVLLLSQDTAAARELWERLWQRGHQPRSLAAFILCELAEGTVKQPPPKEMAAAATSAAFIEWYRKAVAVGARDLVVGLNARTEQLKTVLPEAARILEAVLAEAQAPAPALAEASPVGA